MSWCNCKNKSVSCKKFLVYHSLPQEVANKITPCLVQTFKNIDSVENRIKNSDVDDKEGEDIGGAEVSEGIISDHRCSM